MENKINQSLSKGLSIAIRWGYDENFNELFYGVITSINPQQQDVTVKALDHSVVLNSIMISQTFVEETASNVLSAVLSDSGLTLEIEESDLEYEVFPIFNESATSVVQKISRDESIHTGVPQVSYARGKTFNWKALDTTAIPVFEFTQVRTSLSGLKENV